MTLFSGKCKFDPRILCGVVKNLNNCPYSSTERCKDDNAEGWLGMNNPTFRTITLKVFRYNLKRIPMSVLENNMCKECRVIWATPTTCPICQRE